MGSFLPMHIENLKIFRDLVDNESFSKAAKLNAAKKKEQKAKLAAAQAPSAEPAGPSPMSKMANEAIMEGANEDGEEEDDVEFPADDDEPKVNCALMYETAFVSPRC